MGLSPDIRYVKYKAISEKPSGLLNVTESTDLL